MSKEQEMREAFEKWVDTKYHVYEGVFSTKDGEYYRQIASKDENDPDADVQSLFAGYQAATLAAEETFNQRLVELTSRIRELEADANRYRWIRENDNAYLLPEDVIDDALTESNFTSSLERQYKENQG